MVNPFAIVAYIAIIIVVLWAGRLIWKFRSFIVRRLTEKDYLSVAKLRIASSPGSNERSLLARNIEPIRPISASIKSAKFPLILAALLALVPVYHFYGPAYQAPVSTYTIQSGVSADALIVSGADTFNLGDLEVLFVGTARQEFAYRSVTYASLVRVPVPEGNITSYTLSLYKGNPRDASFAIAACPISLVWEEMTVSWRTLQDANIGTMSCWIVPVGFHGWYSWNLTTLISPTNDTVLLARMPETNRTYAVFDSRESSLKPPFVNYTYIGRGPPEKPMVFYFIYVGTVIGGVMIYKRIRKRKKALSPT